MDKSYNSRDARTNWRDVLDFVQGGGSVTITRSGKAVARVVPVVGPAKVGDRWGDLTPEQQAGVPVGAIIAIRDHDGTLWGGRVKRGPDAWSDFSGTANTKKTDAALFSDRILTHIPAVQE